MSDQMWPDGLKISPMREWPGPLTPDRQKRVSKFRSGFQTATPLSETMVLLKRELKAIGARNVEMLIALRPEDFRNDGYPRAAAKAAHSGIVLSFDNQVGHLSYPCDTFTTWQDNLRAVALALEALRKVDRYGVTKNGEQYKGFLELEAPKPGSLSSVDAAVHRLEELTGIEHGKRDVNYMLRRAQRLYHPDISGPEARPIWDELQQIEQLLKGDDKNE